MQLLVTVTMILASAALATAILRRASAATRHSIWAVALAASLAAPLFQRAAAALPVDLPPALAFAAGSANPGTPEPTSAPLLPRLEWIWAFGAAISLARLAWNYRAASSLASNAPTPYIAGVFRPRIILPAHTQWPAEAIAHEQAHIARRDPLWNFVGYLAQSVYWFHPLARFGLAEMRRLAEQACDDHVINSGSNRHDYAQQLVHLARAASLPSVALGFSASHRLEPRIRRILSTTANRGPACRVAIVVALAAAALIALPGALAQDEEVHKVGGDVLPPKLIHKVEPEYTDDARDENVNGSALLSIVVGKDGQPRDIKVVRGLHPSLDREAVNAIAKWRFEPGTRRGEPVNVRATIEMTFRRE